MTEQEENELICERLLGWHRPPPAPKGCYNTIQWVESRIMLTPTFTTWDEAGLILDALADKEVELIVRKFRTNDIRWSVIGRWAQDFVYGATGPLAIRAAALAYLRAPPQANARE